MDLPALDSDKTNKVNFKQNINFISKFRLGDDKHFGNYKKKTLYNINLNVILSN